MRLAGPIKVLIVDNSPLVRSVFARVLTDQRGIAVVGGAKDPTEARELILAHRPDVIILDSEMPRMDGIAFLRKLRAHYPVPVIMCINAATAQGETAAEAMDLGAIDVIVKPSATDRPGLQRLAIELADQIRAAAAAIPRPPAMPAVIPLAPPSFRAAGLDPDRYLVAIGASTGGTEALKDLLAQAPADFPPVAIVQHMPGGFTRVFAERLDRFSRLKVTESSNGQVLASGLAVVARGGVQMTVGGLAGRWRIVSGTSELVNRHCPSVDVLFDSVVRTAGCQAVGILLSGMGSDGAQGLLAMRKVGAVTIAQDQRSCVVYGMPKVAAEIGAVDHVAPPNQMPALVLHALRQRERAPSRV